MSTHASVSLFGCFGWKFLSCLRLAEVSCVIFLVFSMWIAALSFVEIWHNSKLKNSDTADMCAVIHVFSLYMYSDFTVLSGFCSVLIGFLFSTLESVHYAHFTKFCHHPRILTCRFGNMPECTRRTANIAQPDQTAYLLWIFTICSGVLIIYCLWVHFQGEEVLLFSYLSLF